jgi:hypothetical protein
MKHSYVNQIQYFFINLSGSNNKHILSHQLKIHQNYSSKYLEIVL